jgi:hypothetical protein
MVSDKKLLEFSGLGETGFAQARSLSTGESASLFTNAVNLIEQDVQLNRQGATAASL